MDGWVDGWIGIFNNKVGLAHVQRKKSCHLRREGARNVLLATVFPSPSTGYLAE